MLPTLILVGETLLIFILFDFCQFIMQACVLMYFKEEIKIITDKWITRE